MFQTFFPKTDDLMTSGITFWTLLFYIMGIWSITWSTLFSLLFYLYKFSLIGTFSKKITFFLEREKMEVYMDYIWIEWWRFSAMTPDWDKNCCLFATTFLTSFFFVPVWNCLVLNNPSSLYKLDQKSQACESSNKRQAFRSSWLCSCKVISKCL